MGTALRPDGSIRPLLPICQCAFPVQGEVAVLWTSAGQV